MDKKKELIKQMIQNKGQLIEMKKSAIKYTDTCEIKSIKSGITSKVDEEENGDEIERTIVGNTYNWLDSAGDVLVSGVFAKSLRERKDKMFHLHDHEFKITSKVGEFKDIYEKPISWKELGVERDGDTESLIAESTVIKEYNPIIFREYKNGKINQHSVGMYYVKMLLGVNDPDEKEEFAVWNKYYPMLGNPEDADEQGYMWIVTEAKLIEISAVLMGANPITPTLDNNTKKPLDNTSQKTDKEPLDKDTQISGTINYKDLLNEFKKIKLKQNGRR